jgi:hypothetical protein
MLVTLMVRVNAVQLPSKSTRFRSVSTPVVKPALVVSEAGKIERYCSVDLREGVPDTVFVPPSFLMHACESVAYLGSKWGRCVGIRSLSQSRTRKRRRLGP